MKIPYPLWKFRCQAKLSGLKQTHFPCFAFMILTYCFERFFFSGRSSPHKMVWYQAQDLLKFVVLLHAPKMHLACIYFRNTFPVFSTNKSKYAKCRIIAQACALTAPFHLWMWITFGLGRRKKIGSWPVKHSCFKTEFNRESQTSNGIECKE